VRRFWILAFAPIAGAVACSSGQLGEQPRDQGVSPGTVTFRLRLPSARSYCDLVNGCFGEPEHVSIATTAGSWLPLSVGLCEIDCSGSCVVHPCDLLCPIGTAVALTQVEKTWDGSFYPSSTCGNSTPCTGASMPAGRSTRWPGRATPSTIRPLTTNSDRGGASEKLPLARNRATGSGAALIA